MASLLETLGAQLGGGTLKEISSALGSDERATGTAISAALPTLLGALARNTNDDKGAANLDRALEKDHDGSLLDNLSSFLGQGDASPGQGILKHVLGGKQQRVESGISQASGLDSGQAGKLMAMIAPVVMAQLGKQKREQKLDRTGLASMLSQERQKAEQAAPQLGMLSKLLDTDGDGDVDLSDLAKGGLGSIGKLFGQG